MNESAIIVEEYSLKEIQNITMSQQELSELAKEVENVQLICKNNLMDFRNEASSLCNEIEKNGDWWKNCTNVSTQLEQISKEKDKLSIDTLYIDGEVQYKKLKIERDKEKLLEIKNLIQEAVVLLKDREHEKETFLKKIDDKHKAYKKAAKYFKTALDFYISLGKNEDTFQITVCYFTQKFDDTYSFTLRKNEKESLWILTNVKPKLQDSQLLALQNRFHKTNNLPALLCTLRNIFLLKKP